jgi:hypothetical protein
MGAGRGAASAPVAATATATAIAIAIAIPRHAARSTGDRVERNPMPVANSGGRSWCLITLEIRVRSALDHARSAAGREWL